MATNRQTIAARDLKKKIRLENIVNRELRKYFAKLNTEFRKQYVNTRTIITPDKYSEQMDDIIFKHYQRVAKVYSGEILEEVKNVGFGFRETKAIEDEIVNADERFVAVQSAVRSGIINNTTEEKLNSIINTITVNAIEVGQALTAVEVAALASKEFSRSGVNRSNIISMTETQNAAEGIKFTEANTVVGSAQQLPDGTFVSGAVYEWNAVLDSRTRPAHVTADGQRRDFNAGEVFNVGGEELRYPGDSSLGASAWNTINCRCLASYALSSEELAFEAEAAS